MKGDWVQAQYFVNPTQWASQAHSVAPLRYQRLDEVLLSFRVAKDSSVSRLVSLHPPANGGAPNVHTGCSVHVTVLDYFYLFEVYGYHFLVCI